MADEEVTKKAAEWLRAIGKWLLETDNDMKLPNGILDTDPVELADALALCDHDYQRGPYAGPIIEYTCSKCGDSYDKDVS